MADTNLNAFTNSCAGYVHTYIIGPIVQHLVSKGYQVTSEELAGVLQLPTSRSPVTPVMPAPAVPAMAFGGAVPPMAAAVAPTANSRKNTATAAPVAGRTCMYQFKRGENKGKYCGKATSPGADYCNACMKSRKGLTTCVAPGAVPGIAPGSGAIPGMGGVPPGYGAPAPANPAAGQGGSLSVVPYDEARGLFREPTHGFIVHQISPGVVAVIGRLIEAENKIVPLTEPEKTTAQNIGLVLADSQQPTPQTPAPSVPSIPSVPAPSVPAVPSIPTVPVAAIPAVPVAAIPAIPSVPSAVPQIPTAVPQPGFIPTGNPVLPTITPLAAPSASPSGVPQIPQINM